MGQHLPVIDRYRDVYDSFRFTTSKLQSTFVTPKQIAETTGLRLSRVQLGLEKLSEHRYVYFDPLNGYQIGDGPE